MTAIDVAYERLMARTVRVESGCLEWTGGPKRGGYSRIWLPSGADSRKCIAGHRLVMMRSLGAEIGAGLMVRHKCDNPPCVEISHLELGTNADNCRDMRQRGRSNVGSRNALAKLSETDAAEARHLVSSGVAQAEVARRLGVSRSCINLLINNETWRHVA